MLNNYSCVRLLTDRYQLEGASRGDFGYVIEVYPDGDYEVEFSDTNGTTTAQIVAREEDIQLAEGVYEAPTPAEPARTIKEQLT